MVLAAEKSRLLLLVKMLKEKQQISVEKTLHRVKLWCKGDLLFHQSCKTAKIKLLSCPK